MSDDRDDLVPGRDSRVGSREFHVAAADLHSRLHESRRANAQEVRIPERYRVQIVERRLVVTLLPPSHIFESIQLK